MDVPDAGFVTFRLSFTKVYSRVVGYGLIIGLSATAIASLSAGLRVPAYVFAFAAVLALLVGMPLVAIMVVVFVTRVGATSVKAFDVWGLPRAMAWQEMASARAVSIAGLGFLRVTGGSGRPLWIPLFHGRQREFVAAVQELSPPDNVLRAALTRTGA
jgi:hypothetical protein